MKPKILSLCAILMAVLFLANTPKADTITIYTIGDSTMANKDTTDGKLERGWAMMLQEFFDESKVVVENHAVNGRSSKSFFEQGRWKPIMDKLKAGDYVFIQFGHNDEKTEDSLRYTDPQTTYKAFLTMYVNDARSKGANPVLLTPIARRTYVKGVKLPIDTHKEYSIAVRQLAKDLDVPMIDMDELSRKLLVQMGDDGAKELYMWVEPGENSNYPDGLKDDTHLNEYGAERMASIAISNLRRLKLPLEKMLLDNVYDENWKDVVFEQPDEWYGTADAQAIAENVLLYQSNIGGWPKNLPLHHKLTEKQRQKLIANKANTKDITLDNGGTYTEMVYLAKVYNLTKIERYKDAVLKGLDYMLAAQYPNGGWPQYYPLRKGYYTHITFNDNLTVNVMTVLQDIIERNPQFAFVDDPAVIQKCQTAFDKGLDCILKAQYRQNGVLTGWCAQHDEKTLLPTNARAFELASLSGSEGANIVLFLMTVKNPSHELKQSIKAAVEWFEKVKIEGVKITYEIDSEGRRDRVAIADPNAKTVWARFYDLETNKPIFVGRDGVKKDKLSDIEYERRNGYGYYTETPVKAIKNYKKYVEKNK